MRKRFMLLAAAAVVLGTLLCTTPVKADDTIAPIYLSNMGEYDTKVAFGWKGQCTFTDAENGTDKSNLVSMTVPYDSLVRIDVQSEESNGHGSSWGYLEVYTNQLCTNKYADFRCGVGANGSPISDYGMYYLPQGTYYLKVIAHRNASLAGDNYTIQSRLAVTAVSVQEAFKITSQPTKKGYEISFSNKLDTDATPLITGVYYYPGEWTWNDSKFSLKDVEGRVSGKIAVDKAGKYTIIFSISGNHSYDVRKETSVVMYHTVKAKDTVKPKVTGVKNGKTYKKAVTIKFSDKGSGIKSATLNKKKFKSGKKVKKAGSYTLVVTDNSGNKTTVKFKIKK